MSLRWQTGVVIGPSVAGVLLASTGIKTAFAADIATYVISLIFLAKVKSVKPVEKSEAPTLKSLVDGLKYATSRKDLLGTYLVDLSAMFFAMPNALFPFWADSLGAPSALGLLYSAGTVGALLVTLTSGWTLRIFNHGKAIIFAALAWGVAIALAGLIDSVPWVLFCLVVAGGADLHPGLFQFRARLSAHAPVARAAQRRFARRAHRCEQFL